jgi:hypothetical protein
VQQLQAVAMTPPIVFAAVMPQLPVDLGGLPSNVGSEHQQRRQGEEYL